MAVGGGRIKERIFLQGTLDADHEDHLQVWLGAWLGEQLAEGIKKGGLPALDALLASKDAGCHLHGLKTGRTQVWLGSSNALHASLCRQKIVGPLGDKER